MANLFIIGNGFDISHGLKTSYNHFKKYLELKYPDNIHSYGYVPDVGIAPKGGPSFDEDEVVGFLLHIISEAEHSSDKWSDLETSIGLLEFEEFFEGWDDEEYENEWHEVYRNQDIASNIVESVLKILDYFEEWIDDICLDDVKPKEDMTELIQQNDKFLSFNYTLTLEEVYGEYNVCHIHGEQGGELLFGHGNNTNYYESNMSKHIGSEDSLQIIQERLKKNTESALDINKEFFRNLDSIDKIYSFGFSFSKVDEIYIKEICKKIKTENITWFLNDFEDVKGREEFIGIIKSCGFNGDFSEFNIS